MRLEKFSEKLIYFKIDFYLKLLESMEETITLKTWLNLLKAWKN